MPAMAPFSGAGNNGSLLNGSRFPWWESGFFMTASVSQAAGKRYGRIACPAGMSGRRRIHAGGGRHKRSVRLKRNRFPQQEAVPNQQFILSREIFLFGDFEGAAHSFRGENGGFIFGCRVVALRCGSKGHFSGAGDGGGMFPSVSQRHGEPGGSRTRRIGVRSGKAAVPRFRGQFLKVQNQLLQERYLHLQVFRSRFHQP